MEAKRFDRIVEGIASGLGRRQVLASLSGGVATLLGLTVVSEGEARKRKRKKRKAHIEGPCGNGRGKANRCKKNRQCCTNYCDRSKKGKHPPRKVHGRCRCRKLNESCTEDRNCCPERTGRTCVEGTCQLSAVCIPVDGACIVGGDPCCDGLDCLGGVCQPPAECGPDTCPNGCCLTGVGCIAIADQGNETCGTGGAVCEACGPDANCIEGTCLVPA